MDCQSVSEDSMNWLGLPGLGSYRNPTIQFVDETRILRSFEEKSTVPLDVLGRASVSASALLIQRLGGVN